MVTIAQPTYSWSWWKRERKEEPKLILIDAGISASLDEFDFDNFVDLFKAVLELNGREAARLMIDHTEDINNDKRIIDRVGFEMEMDSLVKDAFGIKSE